MIVVIINASRCFFEGGNGRTLILSLSFDSDLLLHSARELRIESKFANHGQQRPQNGSRLRRLGGADPRQLIFFIDTLFVYLRSLLGCPCSTRQRCPIRGHRFGLAAARSLLDEKRSQPLPFRGQVLLVPRPRLWPRVTDDSRNRPRR